MAITHNYTAVWAEPQNRVAREHASNLLQAGIPVLLTLQPGDATRYEFLLTPHPTQVCISDGGREPQILDPWIENRAPMLYVTILRGLGSGVESIPLGCDREDVLGALTYGDIKIENEHTRLALTDAIVTLWTR